MRALYISHNGMLENLGQAQVLPYVRGLTKRGVQFDLLSYELPEATRDQIEALRESLASDGIRWLPMQRAHDSRLRRKVFESSRGVLRALSTAIHSRPDIIHGRSYLPTAIADVVATTMPKTKLLFDCRGMVGEENVDAGYWTRDRLEYRLVTRYERRMFHRAEGIVVLTDTLKRILLDRDWIGPRSTITSIPCCVDMERFRFDERGREDVRRELGLSADRLVVVYSGSLGGWYMEDEIAMFVGLLKRASGRDRPITMLVLTPSKADNLTSLLEAQGVRRDEIIVRRVPPKDMAKYLSAGDLALSFIKSCFSKLASSPTKVAEYLACGLPAVLNGDIGDQNDLNVERDACVVVRKLDADDLAAAVEPALALTRRSITDRVTTGREIAERRFGMERVGVARYASLYETIAQKPIG